MYEKIDVWQQPSSAILEALKVDKCKSFNEWFFAPTSKTSLSRQAHNGWYPVKGEYYSFSETEVAGHIYCTIGQNGMPDKEITIFNDNLVYDSAVSVMNRTSYTEGKNLIDTTYYYKKRNDGSYKLYSRLTYSYHYFDHFEADSFYYAEISHLWDEFNRRWINDKKIKWGYHNASVEFLDRFEQFTGWGDMWQLASYGYDSVTYDQHGFVDTLYCITSEFNDRVPRVKCSFTYDEQGRYTQEDIFSKSGNAWNKRETVTNITWTEWHGFTMDNMKFLFQELVSPYKRSKKKSSDFETLSGHHLRFHQKWWDIDGTKSNSDTSWYIIDDKFYYGDATENIYNEYGDYVAWRHTGYSYPTGQPLEQQISGISEVYHKYVYDEIYGMTEHKVYLIDYQPGKEMDTTFLYGFKYTDFTPVSIPELPQDSKHSLTIIPNPTSGQLKIESGKLKIENVEIFDLMGRMVMTVETHGSASVPQQPTQELDISKLPTGMYFVRIRTDAGTITRKVVKR
jgi:hypothetical protein